MTVPPPEELLGLASVAPTDRARAAAWLVRHPQSITTRALMRALQSENVLQVRRLLLEVLATRQKVGPSPDRLESREQTGRGEVPTASSEPDHLDIAALVRHELSPAVGWIRLAADDEIQIFENSRTNEAIRKLQRRIDGLVAIIKSTEELHLQRLSLSEILIENWPDPHNPPSIVHPSGGAEIDIEVDEGLFSMLLANIFQNAIDASRDATGGAVVQITWGYTAQNFWVRISNPFKGDRFDLSDVADVGSSSKKAHQGQGLALIKTVASRLGLAVTLEGISGTASFSFSGRRPND